MKGLHNDTGIVEVIVRKEIDVSMDLDVVYQFLSTVALSRCRNKAISRDLEVVPTSSFQVMDSVRISHAKLMPELLDTGEVDANSRGKNGRTLSRAAVGGH